MIRQRTVKLIIVGVLGVALVGCGGITDLADTIDRVGQIGGDFFDDGALDAQLYLDGQPVLELTADVTEVTLPYLPLGNNRLHGAATSYRGATHVISVERIDEFDDIDFSETYVGGQITGSVILSDDGVTSPAAGALVYAIPAAREVLTDATVTLPGSTPPFAAYTNADGQFNLRALPGDDDYLVIATVAGYGADMELILGLGRRHTIENLDLTLQGNPALNAGVVSGIVQAQDRQVWGRTSLPRVRALLATVYSPPVPQATIDSVTAAAGVSAVPAFRFRMLSTLADTAGSYVLPLPPGGPALTAFALGYMPDVRLVAIQEGEQLSADFTLAQ